MGPVLDQYFSRRAPFDEQGSKEFPDAIALLALENWCVEAKARMYVVSGDKAVQRAATESERFIGIASLEQLLALVASAEQHDIAKAAWAAFDGLAFLADLEGTLRRSVEQAGAIYSGDRFEGEVVAMEMDDLKAIEDITILRVSEDQVACVANVRLAVSAAIHFTDISDAFWDKEDSRYYGGESAYTEIRDTVAARIFVEMERDGENLALSSAHLLTQNLTVSESFHHYK